MPGAANGSADPELPVPLAGGGMDEAELGYRLRRSAWGHGYGTEGSRALIRKGFTELGVWRVSAQTMSVNLASRRLMEEGGTDAGPDVLARL